MTQYFDDMACKIRDAQATYDDLRPIEHEMVWDVTVGAMADTDMPEAIRKAMHQAVLDYGVQSLPVNAPEVDFEHMETYKTRLHDMCECLHDIYHEYARTSAGVGGDNPKQPLYILYARGEEERENMIVETHHHETP